MKTKHVKNKRICFSEFIVYIKDFVKILIPRTLYSCLRLCSIISPKNGKISLKWYKCGFLQLLFRLFIYFSVCVLFVQIFPVFFCIALTESSHYWRTQIVGFVGFFSSYYLYDIWIFVEFRNCQRIPKKRSILLRNLYLALAIKMYN